MAFFSPFHRNTLKPARESAKQRRERARMMELRSKNDRESYFMTKHWVELVLRGLAIYTPATLGGVLIYHFAPSSYRVISFAVLLLVVMWLTGQFFNKWRYKFWKTDSTGGQIVQVNPKNNFFLLLHDEDDVLINFDENLVRIAKRKLWQTVLRLQFDTLEVYAPNGKLVNRYFFVRKASKILTIAALYRGIGKRTETITLETRDISKETRDLMKTLKEQGEAANKQRAIIIANQERIIVLLGGGVAEPDVQVEPEQVPEEEITEIIPRIEIEGPVYEGRIIT